jgi:hypothetical protein
MIDLTMHQFSGIHKIVVWRMAVDVPKKNHELNEYKNEKIYELFCILSFGVYFNL